MAGVEAEPCSYSRFVSLSPVDEQNGDAHNRGDEA